MWLDPWWVTARNEGSHGSPREPGVPPAGDRDRTDGSRNPTIMTPMSTDLSPEAQKPGNLSVISRLICRGPGLHPTFFWLSATLLLPMGAPKPAPGAS